ncbi:hypothetical protein FocTR4_00000194, partial [Fusarium oxysporum f. sp. cubense]
AHSPFFLQHKTAATVAENRDAQRRSRARRQELIADLQSRLEEYERMGVEASIEMQRVAQAVSVQNQRLKDLLGVTTKKSAMPTDDTLQGSSWPAPSMNEDAVPMVSNLIVPTAGRNQPSSTEPLLELLSDSFDSSNSIVHSGNRSEPLETSCDKAAEILVEFHSQTDPSWARSALGCHGDNSCSVKNTKIFQLMDHIH